MRRLRIHIEGPIDIRLLHKLTCDYTRNVEDRVVLVQSANIVLTTSDDPILDECGDVEAMERYLAADQTAGERVVT